jgi:uncharacterized protein YcbK (DUF882 family)
MTLLSNDWGRIMREFNSLANLKIENRSRLAMPVIGWEMMSRRRLFRLALPIVSLLVLPFGIAAATTLPLQEHRLLLYHLHTNERINIVYRIGDSYVPDAVGQLDHFLRDHRTGDVTNLDPRLFDLLSDLTVAVGHPGAEIDIVCGYRTPWSNEFLRRTTVGVAQHSQHILGEAIDIRIPGVPTARLRDAALSLHRGGVGYYPQSQFVHVDLGPIRRW